MTNVLIVEDSRVSREAFERTLSADPEYSVVAAIENAANAEIACMTKAQRIAEEAFRQLLPEIRPGMTERQLAARLQYLALSAGAEYPQLNLAILTEGQLTAVTGEGAAVLRE